MYTYLSDTQEAAFKKNLFFSKCGNSDGMVLTNLSVTTTFSAFSTKASNSFPAFSYFSEIKYLVILEISSITYIFFERPPLSVIESPLLLINDNN